MRIADRAVGRILAAPLAPRHWRALGRILITFDAPVEAIRRYLLNRGRYPWRVTLRTPTGPVTETLDDRHDLLTVCEIFCRRDYGSGRPRLVVDIGANVGLAALFFLTRRRDSFVVCCEPDPANIARLRRNLSRFDGRYELIQAAVVTGDESSVRFRPAGRYGRIDTAGEIEVQAVSIDRLMRTVTATHGRADLVKIDTEGSERELAAALPLQFSPRALRWEDGAGRVRRFSFR